MAEIDYSYQRRMGSFLEDHIPSRVLKKRNEDKSWEYGYNKEYDVIVVSKDGTISQPYELQDIKICSPAVPEDETTIENHGKTRDEQVWTPMKIPDELLSIEYEVMELSLIHI